MRIAIKIAYDGTDYAGWQRQPNAVSVQEKLEEAIRLATGRKTSVTASGRTDAGVHAMGQICHFDVDEQVTIPAEKMPECLNQHLPADIRVLQGWRAKEGFDSNRSAKKKTYCYRLYEGERDLPILSRYAVRVEKLPSLERLQEIAKEMEGEKDFKAFCASGSSVKTTVRTVYKVDIVQELAYGYPQIAIYVTGNGFLYNMVRTMVGELLDVAGGKRTKESLLSAFLTGDRSLLGKTMPAKGLTLSEVEYD